MVQAVEAARTVEDHVIVDPREADVGSILGFGFAPFTGGTLSYIDFMGTKKFVELCHKLEAKYGSRFTPPKLLEEMAAKGETFYGRFPPKKLRGGGVSGRDISSRDIKDCRPGQAKREPGPITTGRCCIAQAGVTPERYDEALCLWVPAFAGTTRGWWREIIKKGSDRRSGPLLCLQFVMPHAAFSSPSFVSASCTFGRAATRAL